MAEMAASGRRYRMPANSTGKQTRDKTLCQTMYRTGAGSAGGLPVPKLCTRLKITA